MIGVSYAFEVGNSTYAKVCTKPDIACIVVIINQLLSNLCKEHWNVVKWILQFLHGTSDLRLCFGGDKSTLMSYLDSYMDGDIVYYYRGSCDLTIMTAEEYSIVYYRGRVHCHYKTMQGVVIVEYCKSLVLSKITIHFYGESKCYPSW